MTAPDALPPLAHLPPERWAEARARAAVVRRYLELDAPTMAQTDAFAAELGLRRTQFRMLAGALAQGSAPAPRRARHQASIDVAADEEIASAIAALGTGATAADVAARVAAACSARGIAAPSGLTVARRLFAARSGHGPLGEPDGSTLLDAVDLGVLVDREGFHLHPTMVAAVDGGSGEIRAWDVDVGVSRDLQGCRTLTAASAPVGNGAPGYVVGRARDPRSWTGAALLLRRLGPWLGRVRVLPQGGSARYVAKRFAVVDLEDVRAAVDQAMADPDPTIA